MNQAIRSLIGNYREKYPDAKTISVNQKSIWQPTGGYRDLPSEVWVTLKNGETKIEKVTLCPEAE